MCHWFFNNSLFYPIFLMIFGVSFQIANCFNKFTQKCRRKKKLKAKKNKNQHIQTEHLPLLSHRIKSLSKKEKKNINSLLRATIVFLFIPLRINRAEWKKWRWNENKKKNRFSIEIIGIFFLFTARHCQLVLPTHTHTHRKRDRDNSVTNIDRIL